MEKNTFVIPKGRYLVTCLTKISEDIEFLRKGKNEGERVERMQCIVPNTMVPDVHCFRLKTDLGAWSHFVKIGPYQVNCYSELGIILMIDLDKYPQAYALLSDEAEITEAYDIIEIKHNLLNPSAIGIRIPWKEFGEQDGCDYSLARQVEKAIGDLQVDVDEEGRMTVRVKMNMEDFTAQEVKGLEEDIKSQFEDECVDIVFE